MDPWGGNSRVLGAATPTFRSSPAPNDAGIYPQRITWSDLTSDYIAQLWHGGTQGSGDVWWTDIGLFAGNYTGGAFSGDTVPEELEGLVQPEDFRWRWLGEPNASESVMEIERVRGMLVASAIAGVSTFEGKPAVRVIITANGGFAYFSTPTILRPNPSTILGTLNLKEPHGTIYTSYARTLHARTPDTATPQTPGEPGSYPLRLSLPPMPSLFQVRLNNGGVYGASTDVWWNRIALIPGNYDGPYFGHDHTPPDHFVTEGPDGEAILWGWPQ